MPAPALQSPSTDARPSPSAATFDPVPLRVAGWHRWLTPGVAIATLAAVAYQFRDLDLARLMALLPASPVFWVAFALYFMAAPVSEWLMFRRVWRLPPRGIVALVRKLVSNEVLLGYSGEVYFYAWARRHARLSGSPFGVIKDVTILSALVGNVVTLAMVLVAAPLLVSLDLSIHGRTLAGSIAIVLCLSVGTLLLSRRLFTLPRRELALIALLHLARIVATTALAALMWHLLLPAVAVSWWLLLATLRLLVSRLPLLPSKDLVFAGVAAFLVGGDRGIAAAMALMATLILAAHLLVGAAIAAADLARRERAA